MALVRMVRAVPEVAGGKTEAMIPEESVKDALANGWSRAEDKKEEPEQEQKPVTEPKTEAKAGAREEKEPKAPAKENKANAAKKNLRDA